MDELLGHLSLFKSGQYSRGEREENSHATNVPQWELTNFSILLGHYGALQKRILDVGHNKKCRVCFTLLFS